MGTKKRGGDGKVLYPDFHGGHEKPNTLFVKRCKDTLNLSNHYFVYLKLI